MDTPAADILVDGELVAALIAEQHPDLAGPLRLVENGWDNAIFRLGDGLAVRLPRRKIAAALARNEQRWLPVLAPMIELPVPAPVRLGQPARGYPWSWSIVPWFDGVPALDAPAAMRGPIAEELAAVLARLHRPAPLVAGELHPDVPRNPVRGLPLRSRSDAVADRLDHGAIPSAVELWRLWTELAAVPDWSAPPVWLHGDVHPGNVLLTAGTTARDTAGATPRLAALLDFGDLTAGDPATDLAAGWLFFDDADRAAFRRGYDAEHPTDDDTWRRARGWALNLATAMLAHSDDNPKMARMGAEALERVLLS